jgi:hypothetical protein
MNIQGRSMSAFTKSGHKQIMNLLWACDQFLKRAILAVIQKLAFAFRKFVRAKWFLSALDVCANPLHPNPKTVSI